MRSISQNQEKNQKKLNFGSQPKVLETIICHKCHNERELGGYLFKLVCVCDECRTAEDLRVLNNRIERRRK